MLVSDFRSLWAAIWPHAPHPDGELWTLVWKPLVERAERKAVKKMFQNHRATHERGQYPPEPNVFAAELDLIRKPKQSGQRAAVHYVCDFCGVAIVGTLEFDQHLDAKHAEEVAKGRD